MNTQFLKDMTITELMAYKDALEFIIKNSSDLIEFESNKKKYYLATACIISTIVVKCEKLVNDIYPNEI